MSAYKVKKSQQSFGVIRSPVARPPVALGPAVTVKTPAEWCNIGAMNRSVTMGHLCQRSARNLMVMSDFMWRISRSRRTIVDIY